MESAGADVGSGGKRTLIALGGGLLLAAVLAVTLFALVLPVGCEDAEDSKFATVLCDAERGSGWRTVQALLVLALIAGCIGALVLALRRVSPVPLLVALGAAIAVFWGVFAIYDIKVSDKPLPEMTDVRYEARRCVSPCEQGFPVSFTLDRPAQVLVSLRPPYEDIQGRQYEDFAVGLGRDELGGESGFALDEGRHTIRVGTRIINPPEERITGPPGSYELIVSAEPQDAGGQKRRTLREFKGNVAIESARP